MSDIIDALQVVVFSSLTHATQDAYAPWMTIFGAAPQGFNQNPPGAAPGSVAFGVVEPFNLMLSISPGRHDFFVGAAPGEHGQVGKIDFHEAIEFLKSKLTVFIENLTVVRVGVITTLSDVAKTVDECNVLFLERTGISGLPDMPIDLGFTMNLRRTVAGFNINRICRWNVVPRQMMQFSFFSGMPNLSSLGVEEYQLVSQYDVNSVQLVAAASSSAPVVTDAMSLLNIILQETEALIRTGRDALV